MIMNQTINQRDAIKTYSEVQHMKPQAERRRNPDTDAFVYMRPSWLELLAWVLFSAFFISVGLFWWSPAIQSFVHAIGNL